MQLVSYEEVARLTSVVEKIHIHLRICKFVKVDRQSNKEFKVDQLF